MKKVIKQVALAGGVLFVGYQGFRMFRLIKSVIALDKALPDYLESVYGEKPKVSCTVNANITINTQIIVKYSAEILAKYDDIEATTRQYIADYYPLLAKTNLKVNVVDEALSNMEVAKQLPSQRCCKFGKLFQKILKGKEETEDDDAPTD